MIALLLALSTAPDVVAIGVGTMSCATSQTPQYSAASTHWIAGFWSGMNYARGERVGRTSDLPGMTAEIIRVCDSEPSVMLLDATYRVFRKLEKEGR